MQEIRGLTHLHFIMIVQGQLSQTIMAVKADNISLTLKPLAA